MSVKRFPKGCWNADCPYFHSWDLSIDDLINIEKDDEVAEL